MYPPLSDSESETYDEALETATTNKLWADRNMAALDVWFNDHIEPGSSVHSVSYPHVRYSAVNIRMKPRLLKCKYHRFMGREDLCGK